MQFNQTTRKKNKICARQYIMWPVTTTDVNFGMRAAAACTRKGQVRIFLISPNGPPYDRRVRLLSNHRRKPVPPNRGEFFLRRTQTVAGRNRHFSGAYFTFRILFSFTKAHTDAEHKCIGTCFGRAVEITR
jgi:hypothetical protein